MNGRYFTVHSLKKNGFTHELFELGFDEYFYVSLDKHFPGMKQRYIERYGNSYELPSPKSKELMSIFLNTCKEHGILCTPDECFAYLNELPEKYAQMSIFDL